jgi:hypothetical protein
MAGSGWTAARAKVSTLETIVADLKAQGTLNKLFLAPITQDGEHGALPTLYAATQDIPGGSYVGPDGLIHTKGYPEIARPSRASRNPDLAKSLWETSARLTQTGFPVSSTV